MENSQIKSKQLVAGRNSGLRNAPTKKLAVGILRGETDGLVAPSKHWGSSCARHPKVSRTAHPGSCGGKLRRSPRRDFHESCDHWSRSREEYLPSSWGRW